MVELGSVSVELPPSRMRSVDFPRRWESYASTSSALGEMPTPNPLNPPWREASLAAEPGSIAATVRRYFRTSFAILNAPLNVSTTSLGALSPWHFSLARGSQANPPSPRHCKCLSPTCLQLFSHPSRSSGASFLRARQYCSRDIGL